MIEIKFHPERNLFMVKSTFERCASCSSPMIKLQEWGLIAQDLRGEGIQKIGSYQDEEGVLHTACQRCIDEGKVGCFECAICKQKRDHTLFGIRYGKHKLCKPCSGESVSRLIPREFNENSWSSWYEEVDDKDDNDEVDREGLYH